MKSPKETAEEVMNHVKEITMMEGVPLTTLYNVLTNVAINKLLEGWKPKQIKEELTRLTKLPESL